MVSAVSQMRMSARLRLANETTLLDGGLAYRLGL